MCFAAKGNTVAEPIKIQAWHFTGAALRDGRPIPADAAGAAAYAADAAAYAAYAADAARAARAAQNARLTDMIDRARERTVEGSAS